MTKKKYETEWDDCFRDEFEEWFFHERSYNPFISQDDFREYPDFKRPPEPPRIEFEFYTPNGEEHRVTFFNRKYFFIEDEENYEKIYKSITSKYKKIKYIVEDYNFEPCKWYESSFGKSKGVGYKELFVNLRTLMKIPTEELPIIVKKNCEEQSKFIQKIVDRYNNDTQKFPSKISAWQYMAHQEIAYPGKSHPYVYQLLPELGEEAIKFKKNKNLYKEVSAILDKEYIEAWKRIRDKL